MKFDSNKHIGFSEDGSVLTVHAPHTPAKWDYFLFNDTFYADYDIHLQGKISRVKNYIPQELTQGYRYFYICDRANGAVWNPNYLPLHTSFDTYQRQYGMEKMELTSASNGIETHISIFVPQEGTREIWQVSLKNNSETVRELDLYSVTGLGNSATMGGECSYKDGVIYRYSFPYHVFYEDHEKVEKSECPYLYMICDTAADTYDMSQRRFFGSDDLTDIPEAVRNGCCSNIKGEAESFCGAMQHRMTLAPGEKKQVCFMVGTAFSREEIIDLKQGFKKAYIAGELKKIKTYWEDIRTQFIIRTPIPALNHMMNYHIKKQSAFLVRLNRKGVYCPVRNRFQDGMGMAFFDTERARAVMLDTLAQQRNDGGIQQWYMTDGSAPRALCLLNHCDGPIWIVICLKILADQMGDQSLYEQQVAYIDGGKASVYEHMVNAVYFMSGRLGRHGLCLMRDGDWTDPANGSGRKGRGESTWATLALIHCINEMQDILLLKQDFDVIEKMNMIRERLADAVNRYAWAGDRYVTGFDDDGKPFGDKGDEDRIFLNAQSWAVISGVADQEKIKILEQTLRRLKTPFGYLVVDPAFEGWNSTWGRISVKKSGTTENGAVYCHASMFMAFAAAILGKGALAVQDLMDVLPENPENPIEKNLQLPLFIPNYYYGLRDSENFGRSSGNYGTGSIAWFILTLLEQIIGVKKTVNGMKIQPRLPQDWDQVYCERVFKDARYCVTFEKGVSGITVNGVPFTGEYLPYEQGARYTVLVGID